MKDGFLGGLIIDEREKNLSNPLKEELLAELILLPFKLISLLIRGIKFLSNVA